ncbi:NIPSNAP family protein [Streptomyces sp. NPDC000410]|uniref:NIPSNAP family protein n=1 Tax=Streptomyces sp. NPDC000410 TaxID=3154254 RepID=UPI003319622D
MRPVRLTDRVVAPLDRADDWLDRWAVAYLPRARSRGMTPTGVYRAHAGPDTIELTVVWTLPHPYAFYAMRSAANVDPQVAEFWAYTDALAIERDRRASELLEEYTCPAG